MTRWDSAAAPLFAVTAREGVWDYVTRAPPPACCTHPALCKHSLTRYHQTPIKDTLTDEDIFQLRKNGQSMVIIS